MIGLTELAFARPDDPYRNLMLEPYEPVGMVPADALRPTALLARTLKAFGVPPAAEDLFSLLQERFGYGRLVWAVALRAGQPTWEVYVYNGMEGERISPRELEDATSGPVAWADGLSAAVEDVDPFSIDLDLDILSGAGRVNAVNGYVNAGEETALSYRITPDGPEMQNVYRRFASDQHKAILRAVSRTLHLRFPDQVDAMAPSGHQEVHIAQKQSSDGVYWVGVPIRSLVDAMEGINGAKPLLDLMRPDLERLGHLRLDVGVDLRRQGARRTITKVGLYGLL